MGIRHCVGNGGMLPSLKGSLAICNNTSNSLEDILLNETTETGKISSVTQLSVGCTGVSSCPKQGTRSWLSLWGGSWRQLAKGHQGQYLQNVSFFLHVTMTAATDIHCLFLTLLVSRFFWLQQWFRG